MAAGGVFLIKTIAVMEFLIESGRIYANDAAGNVIAEVTFPTCEGISTIDHTFVDDSLRGQGIAGELVRLAADRIMAAGNKIAATCPYAVVWFRRHPEYPLVGNEAPPVCKIARK